MELNSERIRWRKQKNVTNEMRYMIKEAFILVHRAVFITTYCVSYGLILLFFNNSNPNIYAGNTIIFN